MIDFMKFRSSEVVIYFYKSTISACMEYYCHVWVCAPNYYLNMLDLQKRVSKNIDISFESQLKKSNYELKM